MRLYLDEDSSNRIAATARARGIDVVSAHQLGYEGISDYEQLKLAGQDGRAVVTRNHRDFVPLTLQFLELGLPHAGLILLPSSLQGKNIGGIAKAPVHFDRVYPEGLAPYSVVWLQPAPEDQP